MKDNVINLKLHRMKDSVLRSLDKYDVMLIDPKYSALFEEDPLAFVGLSNEAKLKKAATYCGLLFGQKNAWESLNQNLESTHWEFMFPGIMSKYNRPLNPIIAFYNELQKAQLTEKKSSNRRKWVESILNDKQWVERARHAALTDIESIDVFISKWQCTEYKLALPIYNQALSLKQHLLDCVRVLK